MKHEWKKTEKSLYLPTSTPQLVTVPLQSFFCITGKGNPNGEAFSRYIEVLYSLSYAVKMSVKQGYAPDTYYDYTVYPLEGVWDIDSEAKKTYDGHINKDSLVFNLMIRQPDFVNESFANEVLSRMQKKKPHPFLSHVKYTEIEEGVCVHMLHVGSYDNEPESFHKMEIFAAEHSLRRREKSHREIYLSDARRTVPEKLKTILRFRVDTL